MFHIKLKGMMNAEPCSTHALCLKTPSTLGLGSNGQNIVFFLLKEVMLHINLKRMEHRAPCKYILILSLHTPSTLNPQMGSKGQNVFSEISRVAYQISELCVSLIFKSYSYVYLLLN